MLVCDACESCFEVDPANGRKPGSFCEECGDGQLREESQQTTAAEFPVTLEVSFGGQETAVTPGQQMVVESRLQSATGGLIPRGCRFRLEKAGVVGPVRPVKPAGMTIRDELQLPAAGGHALRLLIEAPGFEPHEGFLILNCGSEQQPQNVTVTIQNEYGKNSEYCLVTNLEAPEVKIPEGQPVPDLISEGAFTPVKLEPAFSAIAVIGDVPSHPSGGGINRKERNSASSTITLSHDSNSKDTLVILHSGTHVHVGRKPRLTPRIFLRNSGSFDPKGFFRDVHSNHGYLTMNDSGAFWVNGEKSAAFNADFQGTLINGHRIAESGREVSIDSVLEIIPCGAASDDQVPNARSADHYNSIIPRLRVRTSDSYGQLEQYIRFADEFGFDPPPSTIGKRSVICVDRLGEFEGQESHVMMQNLAQLGSDESADIRICGQDVKPFHAEVVTFQGSFWIRPKDSSCSVKAYDGRLKQNEIAWLQPRTVIQIGRVEVTISEFRQHIEP